MEDDIGHSKSSTGQRVNGVVEQPTVMMETNAALPLDLRGASYPNSDDGESGAEDLSEINVDSDDSDEEPNFHMGQQRQHGFNGFNPFEPLANASAFFTAANGNPPFYHPLSPPLPDFLRSLVILWDL